MEGEGPISAARRRIGEARFSEFIEGMGRIDAEQMFLTLAVSYAPTAGYSDEALDAIKTDANDMVKAAIDQRDFVNGLCDVWAKQRDAEGKGPA